MLGIEILRFLKDLSNNNDKEWFDQNRDRYKELRKEFMDFTQILIHEIRNIDDSIPMVEPKNVIFRINRDIRFSHDKSPYKTNFGAFITPSGKHGGTAGYYLHLEPGECFAAGGMYMPPGPVLKAVRSAIFDDPDEFRSIIHKKSFQRLFPEIYGEKLKTAPQGYPKEHPDIDLVRYKSYTVMHPIKDEEISRPDLMKKLVDIYTEMKPFNRFLNRSLELM